MIRRSTLLLAAALALAACDRSRGATPPPPPDSTHSAAAVAAPQSAGVWRSNPSADVGLREGGDSLVVETGPHTILWRADGGELAPPYTVRAVLEKRAGRLHEGYGLLFGGSGLNGPEAGQVYSYFLVRGDGSFLVKRRQGAATPVVRDWTTHPVIRRDQEETGRPNELEVAVGDTEVVFRVNGTEVARVPAAELSVRGAAGLRTAHEVTLAVRGFRAEPGASTQGGGRP